MEGCIKCVVSGEVDSGKSTLIGSFLYQMGSVPRETISEVDSVCRELSRGFEFAYLLDSLEEERKGEFTLDTTQAFCKGRFGPDFLFIDVPGHLGLLKNMLCGSSSADEAVLVLDAAKGLEPGARRHAHILNFLGVTQLICCVNKMDRRGFDPGGFSAIKKEALHFLQDLGIRVPFFIPVSAKEGENLVKKSSRMPWYKGPSLKEALCRSRRESRNMHDFYFSVQDTYKLRGAEKVFLGSALSGRLKRGQIVKSALSGSRAQVIRIRSFPAAKAELRVPESAGLVLSGDFEPVRGDILYCGKAPQVCDRITARIFCIGKLIPDKEVIFRCLTQETRVKISGVRSCLDLESLEPVALSGPLPVNSLIEAELSAEDRFAFKGFGELPALGRFVIQDDNEILAVGIIF